MRRSIHTHSPKLGGQHFEITNSDDSDASDELIPFSSKKTDACSTSEGADTEQQKAYEAQKLEEEICRRSPICAKSHSFLEFLTEAVSYYNSIPCDAFGSVNYQMLCCPMKRRFDCDCQST